MTAIKTFGGAVLLLAAITIGVVGYNSLSSGPDAEEQSVLACEVVLKTRLRSPSTYSRVLFTPLLREQTTIEAYLGIDTEEGRVRAEEYSARNPEYRRAFDARRQRFEESPMELVYTVIEYDAQNAFGTPVREWARCEDFVRIGTEISVLSFRDPRINGKTFAGWILYDLESI